MYEEALLTRERRTDQVVLATAVVAYLTTVEKN